MYTIGLDIGTTTISAVVMQSETNKIERACTITNDSFIASENSWEKIQNPAIILEKAVELLDKLIAVYTDIDAIGLTGQMHGIVYVNKEGKHIGPLYTWQDESGNRRCIQNKSICEYVKDTYGEELYTGYGLATCLYHAVTGQLPQGAEKICTIMDYLGMHLSGRTTPLMHWSNAASLGLFDAEKRCFRTDVLGKLEIKEDLLPQVTDKPEVLGCYREIPVCVAIGDNQASFFGTVDEKEDTLLVNIGTGSQISVYSKCYCDIKGVETRPFLENDFLLVGAALCGGRAYALLERFFRSYAAALGCEEKEQYELMAHLLKQEMDVTHVSEKHTKKLQVIPTFSGTRGEPEKSGAILNINTENFTPSALIMGMLEGMVQELYDMYAPIEKILGTLPGKIMASGNGIRKNTFLQEMISKRFSLPLELSLYQEEAARGAARAGLLAAQHKNADTKRNQEKTILK